jgi:asparagine synthase (glutamine-hydrolysing)
MELSGGLDSSIVAGALGATGLAPRVAQWVNRVGDRAEGDERRYAEAVTARLGVPLTTVPKPMVPLEAADLAELAAATWPAINGADPARDRDMTARLAASGAGAIVSGQGGDAVFFQMPSALVCAEVVARDGLGALRSEVVLEAARRLRRPVWSILWEAWSAGRGRAPQPSRTSPLLAPQLRAGAPPRHPWSLDAEGVPPARRLQIEAIAYSHLHRGDARRRRAGDLIYPLLAQPVIELCLTIPVADLAAGLPDRPFARQALADRVPPLVLHRRTKGALTSYFARLVALSRPMLRPFLLDGCLVEAGVLDRSAVAAALEPQQLIWAPRPVEILQAAMTEAWVRQWQGRAPDSPRAPRD